MPSLIEHERYFTSLPRSYYHSPDIFEAELRRVFSRQWLYAGQTSQVRAPGDYYVREVGPESLIITRDSDRRLRAFFNVCRHRGSRICHDGEAGTARHFVCPYHRWSYGIDGRLAAAPGARDGQDFDYDEWGLQEAHCDSYFGSVYVYLADEDPPEPLYETLAAVTSDVTKLALVEPERTKVAHREVYEVGANWKTLLENNCECYHCPGGHPSLCVAWNPQIGFLNDDGIMHPVQKDLYIPLREGTRTFSIDGDWVCSKPLGVPQAERFSVGYILTPNFSALAYFADHGVAIVVEPISVNHSRLIAEWFVHEDAVEGVDYDVSRLIEVFHVTNLEDLALVEQNYRGTTSLRYRPGPNNPRRETFLRHALTSYETLMAATVEDR